MVDLDDTTIARFWEKVDKSRDDACWNWTSAVSASRGSKFLPYGFFTIGNVQYRAHRLSYFMATGVDPKGMIVMHVCDNPRCVNPDHLKLGTYEENNADRDAKGRMRPLLGSNNGRAKFTDDDVRSIRSARAAGTSMKKLAAQYEVSEYAIYYVAKIGWKHL